MLIDHNLLCVAMVYRSFRFSFISNTYSRVRLSCLADFLIGILLAVFSVLLLGLQSSVSFSQIIHLGFVYHLIFCKTFFYQDLKSALLFIYHQAFYYLLGFPC